MNVGILYEDKDDGLFHLVVRVVHAVHARRFASREAALRDLQPVGLSFDDLMDLVFDSSCNLKSLRGRTEDWVNYFGRHDPFTPPS
jgi:hypothetical protein